MSEIEPYRIRMPFDWENGGKWAKLNWDEVYPDATYGDLIELRDDLSYVLETRCIEDAELNEFAEYLYQQFGFEGSTEAVLVNYMMAAAGKFNWVKKRLAALNS